MKRILLYLLCCFSYNALAKSHDTYKNKLNNCRITKNTIDDYEPVSFGITNNLLRKAGQVPSYCGTKILIKGRVLDQNCVPVSDAKIYLWQVGCDGKYPYTPLRKFINHKRINIKNSSSFTGSGIATSNNNGEFYFITLYPASTSYEKPNVNVRVEHYSLEPIQTKLYLSAKSANSTDIECGEISQTIAYNQDAIREYYFEIVLPGTTLKKY